MICQIERQRLKDSDPADEAGSGRMVIFEFDAGDGGVGHTLASDLASHPFADPGIAKRFNPLWYQE